MILPLYQNYEVYETVVRNVFLSLKTLLEIYFTQFLLHSLHIAVYIQSIKGERQISFIMYV